MSHKTPRRGPDDTAGDVLPQKDSLVEALRDMPRLRPTDLTDSQKKPYTIPAPMVSRLGALAQGCGGALLLLLGVPMVLVALGSGFYLWGPNLLVAGGVLLLGATLGVWRGKRMQIMLGVAILVGLVIVAYFWNSFIPATAALAPLGGLGLVYAPASQLVWFVLVATLILHVISLFYWQRLTAPSRQGVFIWGGTVAIMLVLALALHLVQQQQRASWLEDRQDTWAAEAATDHLVLGANVNVTLGNSFVSFEEGDDVRFEVRQAELQAVLDSGAQVVRVGASGDLIFERENPRLFTDEDETDEEKTARLDNQLELETAFMDLIAGADVQLFISDLQYSPYLLAIAQDKDEEDLTWEEFTALHEQRIRRYARQYQPAYYEVVNEPDAYARYSGVTEVEGDQARLDAWVQHTVDLIAAVAEESPNTQVGVAVSLDNDFERDYYRRVLELDGVDFIGLRVYQAASLDSVEDVFVEDGRPQESGKQLWITETWFGYCLARQRSMEHDAAWLKMVVAFAAKEQMTGVLSSDFGCFIQPGGTLFSDDENLNRRTAAWQTWHDLIAAWRSEP